MGSRLRYHLLPPRRPNRQRLKPTLNALKIRHHHRTQHQPNPTHHRPINTRLLSLHLTTTQPSLQHRSSHRRRTPNPRARHHFQIKNQTHTHGFLHAQRHHQHTTCGSWAYRYLYCHRQLMQATDHHNSPAAAHTQPHEYETDE